jgi:hypothetical protein
MSKALFPHHDYADADGLESPDPELAKTGYFHHDPDSHSKRLREWHQKLWSKPLPRHGRLNLQFDDPGLRDEEHDQFLKSDAAMPVWERWGEVQGFLADTQALLLEAGRGTIHDLGWRLYDMGGMILFPGYQVNGLWTINQAKGCTRIKVADRLDLTVECIRLYYEFLDQAESRTADLPQGYKRINPLGEVLHRYHSFFAMFDSFEGYVTFWLLDDLVTRDSSGLRVDFHLPRARSGDYDFTKERALPVDKDQYLAYLLAADDFVDKRNRRMATVFSGLGREVCPACLTEDGGAHHRGW